MRLKRPLGKSSSRWEWQLTSEVANSHYRPEAVIAVPTNSRFGAASSESQAAVHSRASRRLAVRRCGRCRMPGKDRFDPQAQPAPDLRIRSAHRLVGATTRRGPVARHGAARAWGHQADPLRLLA